jgi:hypothetical protein
MIRLTGRTWNRVALDKSTVNRGSGDGSIRATYDSGLLNPTAQYRGFDYKYNAVVTFPGPDGRQQIVELSSDVPVQTSANVKVRSALIAAEGTVLIQLEKIILEAPTAKNP